MTTYDKYYETEELFGEPYPELVDFFKAYPQKGKLLDIGCGQGRNAIALAKLGYEVTGVDMSKVGIEQVMQAAEQEQLLVNGVVADIYSYDEFEQFDIVLLDSMFHFTKKDIKQETGFIKRMLDGSSTGTLFVFCIQNMKHKTETLRKTIGNRKEVYSKVIVYTFPDAPSTEYLILAVSK